MWAQIRCRWRGLAAAGAFALALLAWALASPIASAPDDDFHIANIYCLNDSATCRSDDWAWPGGRTSWAPDPMDRQGPEYQGAREAYPDLWEYEQPRALPCYVTNGGTWYAPDAAEPADCLNQEDPTADRPASVDNLGYYPSLYYRLAALFTGDTLRESVVHWRILNVIVAITALSASLLLSARGYRRPIAVAALTASMPLGLFLVSSSNPSAWLLIGTAAFLGPALTLLRDRSSPRLQVARGVFVVGCLLIMLAGRSEALGHAAVLVVVALILGLKVPRFVYGLLVAAAGLLGVVAVALLNASDASKVKYYFGALKDGLGASGLWDALMTVPDVFLGPGAARLGWLEIVPPPAATIAVSAAFWGSCILGLGVMFWRKGLAITLAFAVLLIVPGMLLTGGSIVYPTRYFLPLVYIVAFAFLVPDWGTPLPSWSNAQWVGLGAALSFANSIAMLYTTVRYTSGISPGTTSPLVFARAPVPEWWWGGWLNPFGNWLLGSLAFAVGVVLLFTLPTIRGVGDQESVEPEAPDSAPRSSLAI